MSKTVLIEAIMMAEKSDLLKCLRQPGVERAEATWQEIIVPDGTLQGVDGITTADTELVSIAPVVI